MSLGQASCVSMGPAPAGFVWCPDASGFCALLPAIPGCALAITAPSIAAATPTSVSFTDHSNPNPPYSVGDQWSLSITGTPGATVMGSASQNGASASSSVMGTTDENGNLTLTGTFGSGDVGTWNETYQVGAGAPASLSFTVQTPPAPAAQVMTNPGPTPIVAPAATGMDLSFLTGNIGPLPLWMWLGGGVLALILVKK